MCDDASNPCLNDRTGDHIMATAGRLRVSKLENTLCKQRLAIDALTRERQRLQLRAQAALLRGMHCHAVVELGQMLAGRNSRTSSASSTSDCDLIQEQSTDLMDGFADFLAVFAEPGTPETLTTQDSACDLVPWGLDSDASESTTLGLVAQLPCDRGCSSSGLNWSPASAAAAAACADLTSSGLAGKICRYLQHSGCLLMRLQRRAPDACAAYSYLEHLRSGLVETIALMALHAPRSLNQVALGPLEGAGDRAWPQADGHALWAARQLELDNEQLDLSLELLDCWWNDVTKTQGQRHQLLNALNQEGNQGYLKQVELVGELSRVLRCDVIDYLLVFLPLFGSVFRPAQLAAYLAACAPWLPSPEDLRPALMQMAQERGRLAHAPSGPQGKGTSSRGCKREELKGSIRLYLRS